MAFNSEPLLLSECVRVVDRELCGGCVQGGGGSVGVLELGGGEALVDV